MNEEKNGLSEISDRELYTSMYASQFFLFLVSLVTIMIFSPIPMNSFFLSVELNWFSGLWQGMLFALIALLTNAVLYHLFPKRFLDDGGLNERVFSTMGSFHIILFCLVVAFVEEWLFRAVLQQLFGLTTASLLFALVHFRYLKKPILFTYVLFVSVTLGLMYEKTNNLASVIVAHFISNAVLAFILKNKL